MSELAEQSGRAYLTSTQVRARYGGISDMSLWRWEHDPELDFPRPERINRRKYYDIAKLEAWDRRRARETAATATGG